jgi:hypothetical protein
MEEGNSLKVRRWTERLNREETMMDERNEILGSMDRRNFLRGAGSALAAGVIGATAATQSAHAQTDTKATP